MAIISTLLTGFSITEFIYKAFMAIVIYWAFHILSQLVRTSRMLTHNYQLLY